MNTFDYSIEKTVVSKKTKDSSRRKIVLNIINIYQEEERAKDSALGYTRQDLTGFRGRAVNNDILKTIWEERRHPIEKWALNTNGINFRKKNFVVHFVEGFRKVEKYSISLVRSIESFWEVVESGKKLRFTTSTLAKAMLERRKNVIGIKEVHSGAVNNMFEKFTGNTG